MTTVNINEVDRPPVVSVAQLNEELTVVIGATSSTETETPAVGTRTRVRNAVEAAVFGNYTDGTLPAALEVLFDENPTADVVAIRHDDGTTLSIDSAITDQVPMVEREVGKRVTLIILQDDTWNVGAGGAVDNSARNDHVTALEQVAERLSCLFAVSAPPGDEDQAIEWAARNQNDRMFWGYPRARPTGETAYTNSAAFAGAAILNARINRGYWRNPNFTRLRSVAQVEREIYFNPRDPNSPSRKLNAADALVLLDARQDGWRLYGFNLNAALPDSNQKTEIKIRTVLDRLEQYAEVLALQFSDRDTTSIVIDSYLSRLNGEIARLRNIRALRTGTAYLDPNIPLSTQIDTGEISLVLEANGVRSLKTINLTIVS